MYLCVRKKYFMYFLSYYKSYTIDSAKIVHYCSRVPLETKVQTKTILLLIMFDFSQEEKRKKSLGRYEVKQVFVFGHLVFLGHGDWSRSMHGRLRSYY